MATATSCENAYDKVLLDINSTRHFHVPFGDFHGLGRDFSGLIESVRVIENKSQKKRTKRSVTFSEINCELLTRVDQFHSSTARVHVHVILIFDQVFLFCQKKSAKKELLIVG